MRYGSVCSGIEAATMAWHSLGWSPAFFSEIERFPSAVLAHHYGSNMPGEDLPQNGIPNLGDMTKFEEWPDYAIDLLVGGTPCQSFSVAGLRRGLADPRGNLMLTYLAIAARYRPTWLVWENVPGALSVDGGQAFASLIGGMAELGYHAAWRVLDAQYIRVDGYERAVPQRRRRVFVVGYLGDWRRAAAVFLEPESLSGNPPPRREAGKKPAPTLSARTQGGGGLGTDFELDGGLHAIAFGGNNTKGPIDVATARSAHAGPHGRLDFESETFVAETSVTLDASYGRLHGASGQDINHGHSQLVATRDVAATLTRGSENEKGKGGYAGRRQEDSDNLVAHALTAEGFDASEDGTGRGTPLVPVHAIQAGALRENPNSGPDGVGVQADVAYTLEARAEVQAVAWSIMPQNSGKDFKARQVEVAQPLMAGGPVGGNQGGDYIQEAWAVRRLTPRECERLQGFTDDFTNIPWRGKAEAPDGPRYKALGNSMAVNVMRWIGRRIQMVEEIAPEKMEAAE